MEQTDWTGLSTSREPVAPLDERTFIERLRLLSTRARDVALLREAMKRRRETR